MDEKNFFAKLAGVGPDGKFSGISDSARNDVFGGANGRKSSNSNGARKNFNPASLKRGEVSSANGNSDGTKLKMNKDLKNNNEAKEKETEAVDEQEEGQLAVDVYMTETSYIIESAIAGVKGEDIDVSITIDSVTINGRRSKEDKDSNKEYLCQECFWGRFTRTVILPQEIDADRAVASFKNGILRIVLPKILRDKPRKLRVRFD
jgi:HSP20 family protein